VKIAVLGAGFAGLAAAYDLARAGHEVTVLDAAERPGGLAAGFKDERWDWPIEHFYHHLFTSDADILGLAREIGFGDAILTRRPVTAQWFRGRAYALDGVGPVLAFPGMPFVDRVRMGLAVAWLKVTRNWRALETVTAADWVRRWMGQPAYTSIWEPLLLGKFGAYSPDIPMSWLWARLHKRSQHLIYFAGGFQAFADQLAQAVTTAGADLRLGQGVSAIRSLADGRLGVTAAAGEENYDRVIVTTAPHVLARLAPELPPEYLAALHGLPYLGAIVAVLALDRPLLDKVYWLSMDKREFPFLACVEHTNFMDAAHYGGERLVYVGDYLPPDHRYFGLTDAQLLEEWLPPLARLNPAFDRSWVRQAWVHRAAYAQPVPARGFSAHIPDLATPIPGLFLASMSQVYPWDRGTNYAVEIGRRAARAAQA
jgi:protoporphyrinogen oxidase